MNGRRRSTATKALIALALALGARGAGFAANDAYQSYAYDWLGSATPGPHAFVPVGAVTGESLGTTRLRTPGDLFVAGDGRLYVADSGNNRILVLDGGLRLARIVDRFVRAGAEDRLAGPQGIFVDGRNHLYIADTGNGRILELDGEGTLVRSLGRPETELIDPQLTYEPSKLVLDKARRIYVIANGVNKGLIELDTDGRFRGFTGANRVTPNALDYLWKLIATPEQRARMTRFVPTEYSNAAIDEDGYIFVTSASTASERFMESLNWRELIPVRKLNLTGTDVLRKLDQQWWPFGDIGPMVFAGGTPSQFVDVALGAVATYFCLDRVRGRIFWYNPDGVLLSAFGRIGDRLGDFRGPLSIAWTGERLLVLDSILDQIVVFRPTEYGSALLDANRLYQERRYDESAAAWRRVHELNTNLEVAYAGIGKAQLRAGEYRAAMRNFELAHVTAYFTRAFQLFRKQVVESSFGWFMAALGVLVAVFIAVRRWRRKRAR